MKQIWAPWRKAYIRPENKRPGCFLCTAWASASGKKNYILERTPSSFALLNLYPYNAGHLLVSPAAHIADLSDLSDSAKLDLLHLCERMQDLLKKTIRPEGFNMGWNLGKSAGAGVPGHLHLHIVPRWNGDSNFMPIIGKTRVISESLDSLYAVLMKSRPSRGNQLLRRKKAR